jgi:hypothetical protein
LDDFALATASENKVDVPIRTAMATGLLNRPSITAEQFADEPLKLLGTEEPQACRPLDQVTPIRRASSATRKPLSVRARAVASPMPDEAPVMTATRPVLDSGGVVIGDVLRVGVARMLVFEHRI